MVIKCLAILVLKYENIDSKPVLPSSFRSSIYLVQTDSFSPIEDVRVCL